MGCVMKGKSLYFTAPGEVEVRDQRVGTPRENQVLVQTLLSGISGGTELLVYWGEAPLDMAADETIPGLGGTFGFPLNYGYSAAGKVIETGSKVSPRLLGRSVFVFHPHESHFLAAPEELHPIPPGVSVEDAIFFPNMETAVTMALDGQPLVGERVVIFGQGVVGLLLTALLGRFPLDALITLDRFAKRREASLDAGATVTVDPSHNDTVGSLLAHLKQNGYRGADLTYEVSGNTAALNDAIAVTGYHGRVLVGSWYGTKSSELNLGGPFHRSRIRLGSSQVSTIDPHLRGRFDKDRVGRIAWRMLEVIKPSRYVTHRFPITGAKEAFALLDQRPEETLQVVFAY